jgi:uncharacterized protein YjeT (DUF2065 family)
MLVILTEMPTLATCFSLILAGLRAAIAPVAARAPAPAVSPPPHATPPALALRFSPA